MEKATAQAHDSGDIVGTGTGTASDTASGTAAPTTTTPFSVPLSAPHGHRKERSEGFGQHSGRRMSVAGKPVPTGEGMRGAAISKCIAISKSRSHITFTFTYSKMTL